MASTLTLQQIIDPLRTYPELKFLSGVGGFSLQPAVSIANDVMQRFLAQAMDWKFNRAIVPNFLTVNLQQDYVTNVTDLGWLEQAWRIDINNTAIPKPVQGMESVRDLGQTSYQGSPFNISWVPNALAQMGVWKASTVYGSSYGALQTPASPIQQFKDASGNILFINSNSLGLSINSPGGTQTVGTPYGTSGNSQPNAGPGATPGSTVVDGTVTWTVADPNGYAMRVVPIPPNGGLAWLIVAVYQKKAPLLTKLSDTISPIPDEYSYLFKQGFLAMAYEHSPEPTAQRKAQSAYTKWEEALITALRAADREREDAAFYPSDSIMGGNPYNYGMPIGPANPYGFGNGFGF